MIVNETKQAIAVFNKYYCDFCNEYICYGGRPDYKCKICKKDICHKCYLPINTGKEYADDGSPIYITICKNHPELEAINNQINFIEQKIEQLQNELDYNRRDRYNMIEKLGEINELPK